MQRASPWLLLLLVLAFARKGGTSPRPTPGGSVLTLAELRALAASVGFPDPDTAAAVAMAESGGNPFAANIVTNPAPGNLPERSFGLWQVNTLAHPEFDETQLLNSAYNAHAALLVSASGTDWSHWTTYTTGKYRQYMPGA